jgi:hypothetical protein
LLFGFQASSEAIKKRLTAGEPDAGRAHDRHLFVPVKTIAASPEACLPETAETSIRTGKVRIAQERKKVNQFFMILLFFLQNFDAYIIIRGQDTGGRGQDSGYSGQEIGSRE